MDRVQNGIEKKYKIQTVKKLDFPENKQELQIYMNPC